MNTNRYIAVIGGSNVDVTGMTAGRFSPNDSNPGTINISAGGVGRNIAENIARLQLPVRLLTAIGDDSFGQFLVEHCRISGIELNTASILPGCSSSIYAAIMDNGGELEAAVSDMKITKEISTSLLTSESYFIKEAEIVIADNNITADSLKLLIEMRGGDILFDAVSGVKLKQRKELIHHLDTVKLNSVEAEILSGIVVNSPDSAEKASKIIAERSISNIFITLGAKGVYYRCNNDRWFLEPEKISAVNSTGSGDAFMAGVAFGRYQGLNGERLLRCGLKCAALAAESAQTVSENMTPDLLRNIIKGD